MEQINFDIQFWKQCCSVMDDWRNFNNVSFKSIMVILYDEGMTTVIHAPRPCRHLVTASLCFRGLFFWDALYTRNRDSERSMINATILERRFERRLQTRFDYGYWNVILLLEKVINAPILLNLKNICMRFCSRGILSENEATRSQWVLLLTLQIF